jgi:hypothetical protein
MSQVEDRPTKSFNIYLDHEKDKRNGRIGPNQINGDRNVKHIS